MEKRHVQGLNSLRGIAIIGVILFHMLPEYFPGGYLGVVIFFVLSGYLISMSVLSDIDSGRFDLINFYIKRVKRIYPVMILGVLFITVAARILAPEALTGGIREICAIFSGTYNIRQIVMNASYFTRLTNTSPFTHLWSMGVELQFYVIFPAIIFCYEMIRRKVGKAAGTIFFTLLTALSFLPVFILFNPEGDFSRLYYGTDTRVFSLMMGSLVGIFQRDGVGFFRERNERKFYTLYQAERKEKKSRTIRMMIFVPVFLLMLAEMLILDGQSKYLYMGGMQIYTIFAAFLVAILIKEPDSYGIGYFFDDGPLGWVGKMSYEFYIAMYPIIFFFGYMKWNVAFYSYIIQGLLIVLFGLVIHYLSIIRIGNVKKVINLKSGAAFAMIAASLVIVYTNPVSSKKLNQDMAQLEAELEENSKLLEKQSGDNNASAKGNPETEKILKPAEDKENASKSGAELAAIAGVNTRQQAADKKAEIDAEQKKAEEALPAGDQPAVADSGEGGDTEVAAVTGNEDITMVGDSVMLGASQSILNIVPNCYVDAQKSRQVRKALGILENLAANGHLANTVVIALGTNGAFSPATGAGVIDYLGPDRKIYWVNVYGAHLSWQDQSNEAINAVAAEYPNVTVIDWASYGAEHPEWFYTDGIHLNSEGRAAYAQLIWDSIQ